MNKIYKVVWSKARQCYVVASELARRSGKKSAAVLAVAACTMSIWGGKRHWQLPCLPHTRKMGSRTIMTIRRG